MHLIRSPDNINRFDRAYILQVLLVDFIEDDETLDRSFCIRKIKHYSFENNQRYAANFSETMSRSPSEKEISLHKLHEYLCRSHWKENK